MHEGSGIRRKGSYEEGVNPVAAGATIDVLSGGRLVIGVGVGWKEEEFDMLGIPFAKRGKRTDEYIEAMKAVWDQNSWPHPHAPLRSPGPEPTVRLVWRQQLTQNTQTRPIPERKPTRRSLLPAADFFVRGCSPR